MICKIINISGINKQFLKRSQFLSQLEIDCYFFFATDNSCRREEEEGTIGGSLRHRRRTAWPRRRWRRSRSSWDAGSSRCRWRTWTSTGRRATTARRSAGTARTAASAISRGSTPDRGTGNRPPLLASTKTQHAIVNRWIVITIESIFYFYFWYTEKVLV